LAKSTDFSKNILVDWTAPVGALFFPVKETVRTVPLHQVNQLKIIYHHPIRKSTSIFDYLIAVNSQNKAIPHTNG
jgi:hypothetical protein